MYANIFLRTRSLRLPALSKIQAEKGQANDHQGSYNRILLTFGKLINPSQKYAMRNSRWQLKVSLN